MRTQPSILHVDLDAFFASVEQLHKPSLRGKPVVVGGVGLRGVVSTASYEARKFGVHSALATAIARRRCPNAAYLFPRFGAYQVLSGVVMDLMTELSPLVEPVSMDEAFIDLAPLAAQERYGGVLTSDDVREIAGGLRARITAATGLTASVGAGTSKLIAKIASDADKPDGLVVIDPGSEQDWLDPQPVRALWGVGPATAERLRKVGVATVAELRTLSESELVGELGSSYGRMLYAIARGQDDRQISTERELKSVSVEDTFGVDLVDPATVGAEMDRLVRRLATRLRKAGRSGRTITIKVRGHDFTTVSRSETATGGPTDDPAVIRAAARRMLPGAVEAVTREVGGVRLLGVGVTGLAEWAQGDLFAEEWDPDAEEDEDGEGEDEEPATVQTPSGPASARQFGPLPAGAGAEERRWFPGQDVRHDEHGDGWVQGSGLGRVTVRFETAASGPGRIKTLNTTDPALHAVDAVDVARAALRYEITVALEAGEEEPEE